MPVEFWLNGWAHLLTPTEITAYLMICDLAVRYPGRHAGEGVGIAPSQRPRYGLTSEGYSSLNELVEFGLLEQTHDPRDVGAEEQDPDRKREVSRYRLRTDGLDRSAREAITEGLVDNFAYPLRLVRLLTPPPPMAFAPPS